MRPRIFSLMLTAFALVIVLGIGGMLSFFWLAVVSFERSHEDRGPPLEMFARAEAQRLAQYYDRSDSWAGVDARFSELERELRRDADLQAVALLDAEGRVVTSRGTGLPPLPPVPPAAPRGPAAIEPAILGGPGGEVTMQTLPIRLRGDQVGALVLLYDGAPAMTGSFNAAGFARGIAGAGLALAGVLLALAAFVSGRISKPISQISGAAEAMAAGDLHVRVRPPAVREVADLAVSFNRMADALAAADQQRRQLTADVAHELRTPLSIIKGRLEGIQDGVYHADASQIEGLLGEVALLERLIDDLRLLALAEAGQLALFPEPVDPAHLLWDAARSFAPQSDERGVALLVEAGAALPELHADPQRIAQVLGNLVSNALRHTPAGGSVRLSATAGAGEVLFAVCDTGSGIAADDLPYIFDRFYRADRSRTRSSGGAGLGLAIARRIVEAHRGRIWAESEPGQGTTVSFALPLGLDRPSDQPDVAYDGRSSLNH
ncbi:MAG: ATP-binding protein [Chloroflexi bacterium OHK40]